jgi:uncharacterized membrane protein YkvI
MKKSIEIIAHLSLWILFLLLVTVQCQVSLQAKPDAPFAQHLPYVVFLELVMGLIFFYAAFFGIPPARRKSSNAVILSAILVLLLIVFAYPAMRFGIWQVLSSVVPHTGLIFLAFVFRQLSDTIILNT